MLDFTIELARRAGALLLAGLDRPHDIELKSPFEVVTDVDRASEELIVTAIREAFPEHAILAEEGGSIGGKSDLTWLLDPLDGTNNYAHGFPFFSVSIALVRGREPILAVIYDPLRDELFSAERGRGAYLNNRPIRVSPTATLARALVSTGFAYDYYAHSGDNNLREFDRLQARTQGVRRAGSAALDLAYVACGRLDAHWELRLKPWDMAAGGLLVLEAGGRVSGWQNEPWDPWVSRMLASNGHIHTAILEVLAEQG